MTRPQISAVKTLLRTALLTLCLAGPLAAGPFSPVKFVNGLAITQFELDQRILFMTLLRQPGDIPQLAMDALIEDRIKQSLAKEFDFSLTNEVVQQGMEEFASQANMSAAQFVEALGKAGVEQQTFRDFVSSGLLWREIARGRLGPTVTISEADIDRALISNTALPALRVRLSEISLNAVGSAREPAMEKAHQLELELRAGGDFAALARANSQGPTARSGGALDWMLLSQMNSDAAVAVRRLAPGAVSEAVVMDDRVVIYQMQETKQEEIPPGPAKVVDYAEFLVPNDPAAIAKIRNTVSTCNDLYTLADGLAPERLRRQTMPIAQLPRDVAGALVTLDAGESSTALTRGSWRVFLMLCRRGMPETEQPSRDEVKLQLTNQRIATLAAIYLEELRSDATISDP